MHAALDLVRRMTSIQNAGSNSTGSVSVSVSCVQRVAVTFQSGVRRFISVPHFRPVVEIPRIRYFWAVTKNTRMGSSDSSDMANSAPTPLEVSELIIELSATGTVNISGEVR